MMQGPLIYLIAGEPSGDLLGARLITALKEQTDGQVRVRGIGGPRMAEAGLESQVPMEDLAVMGLTEVLPHLFTLKRHMRDTQSDIEASRPNVLVTIDSPGFCHRISKSLRATKAGRDLPIVHYVAPTVWAWKPKRAEKIAQFLTRLMVILPFEPPYFTAHGLPTDFVGHPAVEAPPPRAEEVLALKEAVPGEPRLLILPGSRKGEVKRLLPIFLKSYDLLARKHPEMGAVIPAVEGVRELITAMVGTRPIKIVNQSEKAAAFAAADVALSAGGTAILELCLAGVPTVAAYRVSALTAFMVRRMLSITRYSLPNIILEADLIPEIYQDGLTPERLEAEVDVLITDSVKAAAQRTAGRKLQQLLGGKESETPSQKAARLVLNEIKPTP